MKYERDFVLIELLWDMIYGFGGWDRFHLLLLIHILDHIYSQSERW
jgi:hypothetical protein